MQPMPKFPINSAHFIIQVTRTPEGDGVGDGVMEDLVEALRYIKELDSSATPVDIINISMSAPELTTGLSEIINDLANTKIIIGAAG